VTRGNIVRVMRNGFLSGSTGTVMSMSARLLDRFFPVVCRVRFYLAGESNAARAFSVWSFACATSHVALVR
jgi:hypothetical protein